MSLILVCSPKGGVGVTTVAAQLTLALAQFGHDAIAVDLTRQGSLAVHFGFGPEAIWPDDDARIVAGIRLVRCPAEVANGTARAAQALRWAQDDSVVIVDVAADDIATRDALLPHATTILCVLMADAGSMAVLPQVLAFGGARTAVVLNQVDERRRFAIDALTFSRNLLGARLVATIRRDEAVNDALAGLTSLQEVAPDGAATADFGRLGGHVHALLLTSPVALAVGDRM